MKTITRPDDDSGTIPPAKRGWQGRAWVTLTAVAAALAVWSVARLAGVDLAVGKASGAGTDRVGPAPVAMAAALAGCLGWGLLAVLERFTPRARTVWTTAALVVLALSLAGPLAGGTTPAAKGALAGAHIAVAAALIPGLSRRARR
jgi:hypothetical protein